MERLENMVSMGSDIPLPAIRRQIASGVDIIIQLGRLRDGSRKVLEIIEITGCKGDTIVCKTLYRFEETGQENGKVLGTLVKKGDLKNVEKLRREGLQTIQELV